MWLNLREQGTSIDLTTDGDPIMHPQTRTPIPRLPNEVREEKPLLDESFSLTENNALQGPSFPRHAGYDRLATSRESNRDQGKTSLASASYQYVSIQ